MQAAGARRLQRARRGHQVSSAHASLRDLSSHFWLRSISTNPLGCFVLSGATRMTSVDFPSASGCCLQRGGLTCRGGVCVGLRARV